MSNTEPKDYMAVAARVAELLGGTLNTKHYYSIDLPPGDGTLWLNFAHYMHKGRIFVSGSWPRTAGGDQITGDDVVSWDDRKAGKGRPSITVSQDKTPEQIAKDIERRLLPLYVPLFKLVAERVRKQDDYAVRHAVLIKEFVALTEGSPMVNGLHLRVGGGGGIGGVSGEIEYIDPDRAEADLKLRGLALDTLRQILKLIQSNEG